MVRSLVAGFGAVTMLAAAGSLTPAGQAILGVKHAAAAPPTAAVVVQPKPVVKRVVPAKAAHRASPQARAAVARRAQPAAPAPSGQSLNLNQLLPLLLQSQSLPSMVSQASLPSVLSQTMPASSPLAGLVGGGSSLPAVLQQLTSPAPEPATAPQPVQEPAPVAPAQSQPAPNGGTQWVPENRH